MKNSVVCADASVSLKLVIPEALSDHAQALWISWSSRRVKVIAPSLWAYEVTSVVRNKACRGLIDKDLENEVLAAVHQLPVQLFRPENLHRRAWELARHFNRPSVYDMHYLALAEMVDCPYWTADERLYDAVRHELNWVHWLGGHQLISHD